MAAKPAKKSSYDTARYTKNRKARIARAIKRDPNNPVLELHIQDIVYRRSTPNTRPNSSATLKAGQLARYMTQLPKHTSVKFDPKSPQVRKPFSMEARARLVTSLKPF